MTSTFPAVPCTATMTDAPVELAELALYDLDVTSIVAAVPLSPQADSRTK